MIRERVEATTPVVSFPTGEGSSCLSPRDPIAILWTGLSRAILQTGVYTFDSPLSSRPRTSAAHVRRVPGGGGDLPFIRVLWPSLRNFLLTETPGVTT
jgi:hypothetical protein